MERYTTIAGEVIEYETPAAEVAAFLAQVVDAAHAPNVSESAMIDLVYGKENPLLDQSILPHQGVVTKAVFADPLYHVMLDLLGRKRVQAGTLDVGKTMDGYTVTVTEAAEQLGVHPSAVRQAIQSKRLDAIKKGGTYLLKPSSVESHRISRRGPAPRGALEVRVGSIEGASARLRVKGGELERTGREAQLVSGRVERFESVALISGGEGKYRYFHLVPSDEDNAIEMGPFFVRGKFEVAEKENNARRARHLWGLTKERGYGEEQEHVD